MAAGVAVGAAAVGHVIDSFGAEAGFVAVVISGLLLTLSVLFVRGRTSSAESDSPQRPAEQLTPVPTDTPAAESLHRSAGNPSR